MVYQLSRSEVNFHRLLLACERIVLDLGSSVSAENSSSSGNVTGEYSPQGVSEGEKARLGAFVNALNALLQEIEEPMSAQGLVDEYKECKRRATFVVTTFRNLKVFQNSEDVTADSELVRDSVLLEEDKDSGAIMTYLKRRSSAQTVRQR